MLVVECLSRRDIFIFFFFNDTATTEIYTLPYTTLFRSRHCPGVALSLRERFPRTPLGPVSNSESRIAYRRPCPPPQRSEEHTSELQSPCNLVCRLLLEKKKIERTTRNNITVTHTTHIER